MQIPYKSILVLERGSAVPLYVQLANAFIQHIQSGIIPKGCKLLGSRPLAELLEINRQTVIQAYEEIQSQGWIEILPKKGVFVSNQLPIVQAKGFVSTQVSATTGNDSILNNRASGLFLPKLIQHRLAFNDGLPDPRLAPREALAKRYAHYINYAEPALLNYTEVYGLRRFRENLATLLNQTRGLSIDAEHILSTRGSQMGIYLVAHAFIRSGDLVVVGELSYQATNLTFEHFGATTMTIPVDEEGLDTNALEKLCQKHPIRMVYVTSHHYHPTTVTLKPERRLHLLQLAETYHFWIIEDDYDYDFHYANRPVLPLASANTHGRVIYIGSFTKLIAPTFRVGYVVASPEIIEELAKIRRIIDRQGDTILEACLADLLEDGTLRRHVTKALKEYRQRRDFTCELFEKELGEKVSFEKPQGGMAIWMKFSEKYPLESLSENAHKKGLYLPNGSAYKPLNACRIGFASMTLSEIEESMSILKKIMSD